MIFHVDVNSAYLSWTAAALLEQGYSVDLRTVPSVIAGDPKNRHGIILAKSIPAKKHGIGTVCSLFEAFQRCPDLMVFPPDYDLFLDCSEAMYNILQEYSKEIERYSIDECFLDISLWRKGLSSATETAFQIKERIKRELGFTVNIGIGPNKILAKMAGELSKPDKVHTLLTHQEIKDKLWPLPVKKLFMVGSASAEKLAKINIKTIGDLATSQPMILRKLLKNHGLLIWQYANGIDYDRVVSNEEIVQKGLSNSMTLPYDVTCEEEAHMYLLSICERVVTRLRRHHFKSSRIRISVKSGEFVRYTHQLQLPFYMDDTTMIYGYACRLFRECWRGESIRQLGMELTGFASKDEYQLSFGEFQHIEEEEALNTVVDRIRERFGQTAIYRGTFVNTEVKPIGGGVNDSDFIMIGGYRG